MTPVVKSPINHGTAINYFDSNRIKTTPINRTYNVSMHHFDPINSFNKRLLHDIFHIGPGISQRLPYQARQRINILQQNM